MEEKDLEVTGLVEEDEEEVAAKPEVDEKIVEAAAEAIRVPVEEVLKHYKKVEAEDLDAYYFWNPVRGGLSVIVNAEGEKLAATSIITYERLLKDFREGKRN